ncbi:MAG: YciI family protein [Hyphomicrobiales bacterium]|nr:YciI family protein [Hyphomicrobiales bacterium]
MAQFMVTALDGRDQESFQRRRDARPEHLERIRPFVESGELIFAGALTDAAGRPSGSVFAMELSSREELDKWIADDPYTRNGVWTSVDVKEIRVGVRDGRITA